jgi:hypothetical protein
MDILRSLYKQLGERSQAKYRLRAFALKAMINKYGFDNGLAWADKRGWIKSFDGKSITLAE